MNRAISFLQLKQLDEALADYTTLSERVENSHAILYGLAEIARQQNKSGDAIKHYEAYLKIAPKGTVEYNKVSNVLAELKGE